MRFPSVACGFLEPLRPTLAQAISASEAGSSEPACEDFTERWSQRVRDSRERRRVAAVQNHIIVIEIDIGTW